MLGPNSILMACGVSVKNFGGKMNETQLNIRVPKLLRDQLQAIADREGRTLASVTRIALADWLDRMKNGGGK